MWRGCVASSEIFGKRITDLNSNLLVFQLVNILKDQIYLEERHRYFSSDLYSKGRIDESHEAFLAIWLISGSLINFPFKLGNQYLFVKLYKLGELLHWMLLIKVLPIIHK